MYQFVGNFETAENHYEILHIIVNSHVIEGIDANELEKCSSYVIIDGLE